MPHDPFLDVSVALTGESPLAERDAAELKSRLLMQFGRHLKNFLEAFEAANTSGEPGIALKAVLQDSSVDNATLDHRHRVARAIITVWYTGQFSTPFEIPDAPQTPEQYSNALLWRVISAHAPGFTNAPFGAWAENPVSKKDG